MNPNSVDYALPQRRVPLSAAADSELDETGAVTNRSNGKSGTNTEAEPDKK
ncbi:MAG: FIG00462522: hypothetical protein [uncultured Paraburkholderia sp.]|nr:MAG: FIG00462522: hypothetical protein [uncultured Paraburkholderia sp.]CAH2913659.1 MAG: FIG00462522: hypothetical protein [uncultured Paraburkholderia sp.]